MNAKLMSVVSVLGAVALTACGGSGADSSDGGTVEASSTSESSGSSEGASTAPVDEAGDSTAGEASFVDGVLTTPKLKITITSHKVIPVGQKGNEYGEKPVIAFWYKTTNLTDEEVTPLNWTFLFTAYQDNDPNAMNELQVGSLPDDRFGESQMENIKKGGTVENAMAYELDDEKTPVILEASDDLGMSKIGKMTYKLK